MNNYKNFDPFQKVLVKSPERHVWECDLYSYWDDIEKSHITVSGLTLSNDDIISFEGNEYLIGTSNEWKVVSEKEEQDKYWSECTKEEQDRLKHSYNVFFKDDDRGKCVLEKVCGRHNLKEDKIELCPETVIIVFNNIAALDKFSDLTIGTFSRNNFSHFCIDEECTVWQFCIKFSDFNPSDMSETRKHILCVKDGQIIEYQK